MSVAASVVLTTTRTFLNDDAQTNWTDAALFPKLAQAHRELQVKLRRAAAPVMKGTFLAQVAGGQNAFPTPPTDLIAPIQLWFSPSGAAASYQLMTEADPLPDVAQPNLLTFWGWVEEVVTFVPAATLTYVKMTYWRRLPTPTQNTDLIGFIDGELYLAPRTAAIAYGTTGDANSMQILAGIADASLAEVILSNRGRAPQAQSQSAKP